MELHMLEWSALQVAASPAKDMFCTIISWLSTLNVAYILVSKLRVRLRFRAPVKPCVHVHHTYVQMINSDNKLIYNTDPLDLY
jgi:hypothetical protein